MLGAAHEYEPDNVMSSWRARDDRGLILDCEHKERADLRCPSTPLPAHHFDSYSRVDRVPPAWKISPAGQSQCGPRAVQRR